MKHFIALLVLAAFCFAALELTIDDPQEGYHGVEKEFEATVTGDIKTVCESAGGQGDGQALYWWKIEEEDIGTGTTDSSPIKSNAVELDFDSHNSKKVQIEICCKESDQNECKGEKVTATATISVKPLEVAIFEEPKIDGENSTFRAEISGITEICGENNGVKYTWKIDGETNKEAEAKDGEVHSEYVVLELEKHHGKKVQIEVRCKEDGDEDPPKCKPPKCVTDEKDITVKGITIKNHPESVEKYPDEKAEFQVTVENTATCKDDKLLFDWMIDGKSEKKPGDAGEKTSKYTKQIKAEDNGKKVSVTVCCLGDEENKCAELPKSKTSNEATITVATPSSSTKNFIAIGAIIASLIMFL